MCICICMMYLLYLSADGQVPTQTRPSHRRRQDSLTAAVVVLPFHQGNKTHAIANRGDTCPTSKRENSLIYLHSNTNNETGTERRHRSPLSSSSLCLVFRPYATHDAHQPSKKARVSQAGAAQPNPPSYHHLSPPLFACLHRPATGQDKTWTGRECSNPSQRRSPPSTLPT